MTFAHLIGGAYAMWKVTTETTRVFCKHSFGRNWGKLRTLLSVSQTGKNIMYNFHYLLLLFNLFWQSHFPQAIELFILFCGVLFLVPFIYNLPNVNSFMFPILKYVTKPSESTTFCWYSIHFIRNIQIFGIQSLETVSL